MHSLGKINYSRKTNSTVYDYSINTNDFANLWYSLHNDLGYPLKIDSRYKRAIIYNKQGLEKQIQQMITEVIGKELGQLADLVANDITAQIDSITQTASGKIVKTRSNNLGTTIASAIGKGLVNGFFNIIDSIIVPDDDYKK